MIIARLHRGGLIESMETSTIFDDAQKMKEWFVKNQHNAFTVDDVVIEDDVSYDERIGWNTRHVCVKRYGDKDYVKMYGCPQCIGMCDLDYQGGAS